MKEISLENTMIDEDQMENIIDLDDMDEYSTFVKSMIHIVVKAIPF